MALILPYRFSDGPGNTPAAANWNDNFDWLAGVSVGTRFVTNGGFETWTAATSFSNPANAATLADDWTLAKSGTSACTADVSREASIIDSGSYSMKVNITGAGSSNSYWGISQNLVSPALFASQTLLFGAKVNAATSGKVRVKVYDGTNTVYSDYHTGSGTWELLQAKLAAVVSPSQITVTLEITPADFTGAIYFDSAYLYVVPAAISARAQTALVFNALNDANTFLPLAGGSMSGTVVIDKGTTPQTNQINLKANNLGNLGILCYGADESQIQFDYEWAGSNIARDTSAYSLRKAGDVLTINGVTGLTPGGAAVPARIASFAPTGCAIKGTTTNDTAAAGDVGEEISSAAQATADGASDSTWDDLTSISLTAGDWLVSALAAGYNYTATWTQFCIGISTTAGNSTTGLVLGSNRANGQWASSSTTPISVPLSIPSYPIRLSTTTTVYLKRVFAYSAGTPRTQGYRLSARRVR